MGGELARRGLCLVVAAASGTGKSSLLRRVLAVEAGLALSVSATTRAPRPGERHGVDYHFTDQAGFDGLVAGGGMLEWATVFGRSYGTPRAAVEARLAAGGDVAFDIDWQGHRLLRAALPGDVVGVFLLPPSLEALRERLLGRGGDGSAEIERRMAAARGEIAHWTDFDHVVVNDSLDGATEAVRSILAAARTARARLTGAADFVERLTGPG